MRKVSFVVLAMFLALSIGASATVIDNSIDAVNNTLSWTAVGQTLTSPGGAFTSYQFWLGSTVPTINFYVVAGDVATVGVGSPLYSTVFSGLGPGTFTASFNVPTVLGNTYSVLFDLNGYTGASVLWGSTPYAGGIGEWGFGTTVTQCCGNIDTGFIATFGASTPEPGSLVLLGTGILGLAGTLRRKLMV
jgi:PEP-CTERM motif